MTIKFGGAERRKYEWQMTLRRRINSMEFAMATCCPENVYLYAETRRNCFIALIALQLEGVIEQRLQDRANRLSVMNSMSL
jgi:hypothetical protein